MKELRFKRRFSQSGGNKAAVVTVPRAIAQAWGQCNSVDLVFDGRCIVITPSNEEPSKNKSATIESLSQE
jgi:hypothetical protein